MVTYVDGNEEKLPEDNSIFNVENGELVSLKAVNGDEDCLIMTNDGIMIRISLNQIGVHGRATQGVRAIRINDDQKVSNVEIVDPISEEEEE